ncbi:enoyl-CoA hydratase/isomerase family protein [Phenylobacterium aquaticum]|uniref:enoyl-CoA hydratase/isomerase family protein n=1 Tax=Phenylobacterium aquaticum TaxID=1763816 RepID=UPI001F5C7077|nr:enoyl-CoA hydratase/isomerase family protein [Phenylobacterium aquaticum]MCI3134389.1 enoyl-CoA hydratase/isomerase family protein [Phenylobacterium aquaticum]
MTKDIKVAHEGHVATVTFSRPPNNHVSVDLMRDLADTLEALDKDGVTRAVVLASDGKPFCAGADLVAPDGIGGSGMGGIAPLYDQAVRLFSIETPIVAAVQGAAVGAGLGLALVADFRVAAPEARFSANFVKLGFHPGFGLTHTLPRLIGQQRANLMFLTGRRVKAEDGLAWGLVDEVVPLDQLLPAAKALALEIAENAPLAVVATRKTLRGDLAKAVREQTNHEHGEQSILRATEDFAEGVRAVQERRPGNFKGR